MWLLVGYYLTCHHRVRHCEKLDNHHKSRLEHLPSFLPPRLFLTMLRPCSWRAALPPAVTVLLLFLPCSVCSPVSSMPGPFFPTDAGQLPPVGHLLKQTWGNQTHAVPKSAANVSSVFSCCKATVLTRTHENTWLHNVTWTDLTNITLTVVEHANSALHHHTLCSCGLPMNAPEATLIITDKLQSMVFDGESHDAQMSGRHCSGHCSAMTK